MANTSQSKLNTLTKGLAALPGDYAEIGVFQGRTFQMLIPIAKSQNKTVHGYDSFVGMDKNSELDFGQYPAGMFDIGGVSQFHKRMKRAGFAEATDYYTFPGFIPECFHKTPPGQLYCFAYVDVDQYIPTVSALSWVWPRVPVGGIMLMDDFFQRRQGLATRAIWEWRESTTNFDIVDVSDFQLAVTKTCET